MSAFEPYSLGYIVDVCDVARRLRSLLPSEPQFNAHRAAIGDAIVTAESHPMWQDGAHKKLHALLVAMTAASAACEGAL